MESFLGHERRAPASDTPAEINIERPIGSRNGFTAHLSQSTRMENTDISRLANSALSAVESRMRLSRRLSSAVRPCQKNIVRERE